MYAFISVSVLSLFLAGLPSRLRQDLHSTTEPSAAVDLMGKPWREPALPSSSGQKKFICNCHGKLDYRRDACWSEPRRILLPSVCSPAGSNWLAGFAYSNLLSSFLFLCDGNAAKRVPPLHSRLRNIFSLVREVVWKPQLQAAGWLATETELKSVEGPAWLKPEKLERATEIHLQPLCTF